MSAFEWDEAKNASNLEKHGVSFEEAREIFNGPVLEGSEEFHGAEMRVRSFGLLGGIVVVCVVYTERGGKTRIISARKATRAERNLFNDYLRKATH